MREDSDDLEGTLESVIARLGRPGAPREARALLIEARRLISLVRNWRTVAPTEAARDQMRERIELLVQSTENAMSLEAEPPPHQQQQQQPPPQQQQPPPLQQSAPRHRGAQGSAYPAPHELPTLTLDEPQPVRRTARPATPESQSLTLDEPQPVRRTALESPPPPSSGSRAPGRSNGAPGDPMRPRTLPDLDISGVAQLMDDSPGLPFDEGRGRGGQARPRGYEAQRHHPSTTPPAGRRRAEMPFPGQDNRQADLGNRPSRYSILEDLGADDPGRMTPAQRGTPRPTPRPSPPPARSDKTAIAVRPLPTSEVIDSRLVLLTDPYSKRAEAYRTLRRKLSGAGAPRTIAVTSAQAGEGKTTCAVNLALAFRETSNEKVLLVEANLKAPSLAKLFGFEPPVCFARQMARNRETGKTAWTVAEQFEPLHVLAVDPASQTAPLMDPVAFANALEQLVEAGYDHIIVDTPPALGGSDVNLVADAVDGVVVVAWIKKSKKSLVKQAIDQLKPATILGVVTLDG